jgi:transposase-like protein
MTSIPYCSKDNMTMEHRYSVRILKRLIWKEIYQCRDCGKKEIELKFIGEG